MEHVGTILDPIRELVHGPGYSGLAGGIGRAIDAGTDLSDDFHDSAGRLGRVPGISRWLLDGREHHRLEPSDVPVFFLRALALFLIINLAIGADSPTQETDDPDLRLG